MVFDKKKAKIKWVCKECNFLVADRDLRVDKKLGKMSCMNCGLLIKGIKWPIGNIQCEIIGDNRLPNPYH